MSMLGHELLMFSAKIRGHGVDHIILSSVKTQNCFEKFLEPILTMILQRTKRLRPWSIDTGAGLSLFTCSYARAMNEFVAESPPNSLKQPTQALSSGEQTFSCKYHRCVDGKELDSYEMCLFVCQRK